MDSSQMSVGNRRQTIQPLPRKISFRKNGNTSKNLAIKFREMSPIARSQISVRVSCFQKAVGVRSQESGVRSQESGVRSQESGVRSQEMKKSLKRESKNGWL